jgi:hypothetical protein
MELLPCSPCDNKRLHTSEDWNNHPFARHGYTRELGWTHPLLVPGSATAQYMKGSATPAKSPPGTEAPMSHAAHAGD